VQPFESSQFGAVPPTHAPLAHVSFVVQALPSSQGAVLSVWTQPLTGSQESSVQGLLSSQLGAAPPTHAPAAQVSLVVQALASSQAAVLSVWTQPLDGSQESSVHPLASSQSGAGPPTQAPFAHVSLVVQALPSSHAAVLSTCTQPDAGLHESSVQPFPSSQLGATPPTQEPAAHVSFVVQALLSLQGSVLSTCTQPIAGLHESSVQPLESLQFGATPPTQAPAAQVSFVVQALPSSHETVLLMWTQPLAGLHESSVQPLASSQFGAVPPTHAPLAHVSFVVQALPSSQDAVLSV
jgi:hypothetical protein